MSVVPPSRPPCARHPAKESSVICARCDRPICTDCMVQAAVGWQCPDCVSSAAKNSPTTRVTFKRPGMAMGGLGATNPTPMVIGLIAINVVVFVASGFGKVSNIDRFGMVPAAVHFNHQYYRLFDAMFLHLNVVHILLNMFSLLIIGSAVESLLGRTRFLALYLIAGLGGSVAAYLFDPSLQASAGASGAIFGLLGAYAVVAQRKGLPLQQVIALIIINLVFSFTDTAIDWHDHIGGLVVGVLIGFIYVRADDIRQVSQKVALQVVGSAATLGILALLVFTVGPRPFVGG